MSARYLESCLKTIFSKIFDNEHKIEMGLKSLESEGLFTFGNEVIRAFFKRSGKVQDERERLRIFNIVGSKRSQVLVYYELVYHPPSRHWRWF